ncbi:methyl-accepting chemotaxis protein [Ferrovibrio sp.]|uniref:methyl-accepting chemotaxis protein n=1 Tax=Ferrovibrio sp. TaxID=1917215 RepID=UPI00260810C5|nr:methyl-accepting chemotaxis protein [Ferrovibrio sp.]
MKLSLTAVIAIVLAAVLAASGGVGYYMSERYEALADESTLRGDARVLRELAADQIWTEHFKTISEVAQAITQANALRAATIAKEAEGIRSSLRAEFRHSIITSGAVVVLGATVYDLEMKPLGGLWNGDEMNPPMAQLEPLAKREGPDRRNLAQFGWASPAGPVQTVVAAIGGFRPAGYVALHVNPLPKLQGLEQRLGMNLTLRPRGGTQALLELTGIPADPGAEIVQATTSLLAPDNTEIADLMLGRNVTALHADLLRTRLTSFGVFLAIAGGIAAVALALVARYIAAEGRRDAEREAAEHKLMADREAAEQAAEAREAAQRQSFEAERKAQEARLEQSVAAILDAATVGDLSRRIDTAALEGVNRRLAEGINRLLGITEEAIRTVASVLAGLAEGDVSRRIDVAYDGLFGALRDDTNSLTEQLDRIAEQLTQAAGRVQEAAGEISSGSLDLSQRTESQAAMIEQTAASMHEVTATVKQNADNAQAADQLAMAARDAAMRGGEVAQQAVTAVNRIEGSAQKISDIVGLIDEIAFQTNLLALNASVEAARAGEAGKGFAVVAQEVRALAQRSANASKDIKTLIQSSNSEVKAGAGLVQQTGRSFEEIVAAIKKVSSIVAEIASASREQASGLEEVGGAVVSMDEMTQRNAALVEQTAAAARSLADQAVALNQLLGFFKR